MLPQEHSGKEMSVDPPHSLGTMIISRFVRMHIESDDDELEQNVTIELGEFYHFCKHGVILAHSMHASNMLHPSIKSESLAVRRAIE